MKKIILFSMLGAIILYGCKQSSNIDKDLKTKTLNPSNKEKINNGDICITNDFRTIPNCKNGELIAFLPNSWGNDQLPLYFITLHCDFNHQIVYNRSGVVCVYTNKRNKKLLENNSKK